MQIDWFTTAAQIVNFLILVWLLKKFLYAPVLGAMERRQQKIADQLQQAQAKEKHAEQEKERYLGLQKEIRDKAEDELAEAKASAEQLRAELFEEVKQEALQARQQWQQSLAREKDLFLEQTGRLFSRQFQQLAASAFKELADQRLEATIIDVFWQKIKQNQQSINALTEQIHANEPLTVTTSFELDEDGKKNMQNRITTLFGAETTVLFEQDPNLLAGINMEAGGKKICWDYRHFLEGFTEALDLALEKEIHAA